jgi:hypothetical protein
MKWTVKCNFHGIPLEKALYQSFTTLKRFIHTIFQELVLYNTIFPPGSKDLTVTLLVA